jgi:hypothetical protein
MKIRILLTKLVDFLLEKLEIQNTTGDHKTLLTLIISMFIQAFTLLNTIN